MRRGNASWMKEIREKVKCIHKCQFLIKIVYFLYSKIKVITNFYLYEYSSFDHGSETELDM